MAPFRKYLVVSLWITFIWNLQQCRTDENLIVHARTAVYDLQDPDTWSLTNSSSISPTEDTILCATDRPELCIHLTTDSPPRLHLLSLRQHTFDFSNDTQWLRTYLIHDIALDEYVSDSFQSPRRLLSSRKVQRKIRREATREMIKINRDLKSHKIHGKNPRFDAMQRILSLENRRNGLIDPYQEKKKHRNPWRKYHRPLARGPEGPNGYTGRQGLRGPEGHSGIPQFAKIIPRIERAVEGIYYHRRKNGKPLGMSPRMHHMQRRVDYILCNVIPGKDRCTRNGQRGTGRKSSRMSGRTRDQRSGSRLRGVNAMLRRNKLRTEHHEAQTRNKVRKERTERLRRKLIAHDIDTGDRVEMCNVVGRNESVCAVIDEDGGILLTVTEWEGFHESDDLKTWIGDRDAVQGVWGSVSMSFRDEMKSSGSQCNGNFIAFGIDLICVGPSHGGMLMTVIMSGGEEVTVDLMRDVEWNRVWDVNESARKMCTVVAEMQFCVTVRLDEHRKVSHLDEIFSVDVTADPQKQKN